MAQEKNQQLSSSMIPPRIKQGEVKKFKLIKAGAIDSLSNVPSYNAGATYEGRTQVFDVERNEVVLLKNVTGRSLSKDKDGKDISEEIISPIEFDNNGMAYIDHRKPETYIFLARDNRCATNPFRDKSVEAVWEEITHVNLKEKEQFLNNLEYEAMSLIKNSDIKDVIAIGKVLSEKKLVEVNLGGNPSDIRWAIEKVCKINPTEVIRAGKEKLPKIKLDIQDAVNHGDIEFQADGNTWVWCNVHGDEKVIHKITPGYDPIEDLSKQLLKEEEENAKKPKAERVESIYQKIKNTLKEASVEAD